MKRIFYSILFLFIAFTLAPTAFGQVFSGCSSCSPGCPSQCPRTPTHERNEGGGGNTNSGPSEAELEARREARREADIQRQRYKDFHKLLQRKDSEETARKWLEFYQREGQWPAAYYNYAITMWHLGHTGDAKGAFLWLMNNCPSYDKSICTDSRKHAISILTEWGTEAYNAGRYSEAADWYRLSEQLVPAYDYDRYGDWTVTGMDPYPWYNLSFAESAQHKWDEAFADATEAAKRTRVSGDPDRQPILIRYYVTYEQVEFNKAVTAIQSSTTFDRVEVLRTLQRAVRYDTVTGQPSYNARALIAQMWHQLGNDDLAEKEASIALLQSSNASDTAQLVLNSIHRDRIAACELAISEDPSITDCGTEIGVQGKIANWKNQCTTITNDSEHPDDARYLNCH